MRSFIAIDIPAAIRTSFDDIVRKLGAVSPGIRWVKAENVHLTLKFLGDVSDEYVPEVEKRVRSIGERNQPLTISLRGTGAFPGLRNPNVLWVGIEASESLEALFKELDISLSEIGFEKEVRQFSPHLTVGRVRDKRNIDFVIKEFSTYNDTFFGTIEVREILLMKSVLKPSGAEYSKVAVINLGEGNK